MFNKHFRVAAAHFMGAALIFKALSYILPSTLLSYYVCVANILLFSIVTWYTFKITKKQFLKDKISPQNKAVLITGCDSGFGHALAKKLDSKGFNVFATCLFPAGSGAEELRNSCTSRLKILELDVTKDESVKKGVKFVEENLGSAELWAVVNNAGIHKGLSLEITSIQDFQECMDVNVFGPIRITKAFLPFLKQSKGRVINITSIAGRVSVPHVAPYVTSKYAAVGFSDLLRQELVDWGISVISIEPEMFRTGLTNKENAIKNFEASFSKTTGTVKEDYDEEYQNNFRKSQDFFLTLASSNIQPVIDDLESAVSSKYPDIVYSTRRDNFARLILYIFVASPIPIRDFFVKLSLCIVRYKKPKRACKGF